MDWESNHEFGDEGEIESCKPEANALELSHRIVLRGLNIHQVPLYFNDLELDIHFNVQWQSKNLVTLVFETTENAAKAFSLLSSDAPFSGLQVRFANSDNRRSTDRIRWPGGRIRDLYHQGRHNGFERGLGGRGGRGRGRGGYGRGCKVSRLILNGDGISLAKAYYLRTTLHRSAAAETAAAFDAAASEIRQLWTMQEEQRFLPRPVACLALVEKIELVEEHAGITYVRKNGQFIEN
ncbi:hypothetical protein M0657_012170 [Pyricularia oryzae]|nr:hypothetical protein M0657_012170 [Pyricularia oryzae]